MPFLRRWNTNERPCALHLIGQLGYGGSERQLFLLLKYADKQLIEHHVLVFNPSPNLVYNQELERLGIQVYDLPQDCVGVPRRMVYLFRLFRNIAPHIVHSWAVHDNPYAGLVGWAAGIPVRWGSVRGSLHLSSFQQLPSLFRWLSLHSVSRLVVNSQAIAHELRVHHVPESRILFMPSCVETNPPTELPDLRTLGLAEGQPIVGAVGNLRLVKNYPLFIEVMAHLVREMPQVRGLIVGQPLPDEADLPEQLTKQVQRHGLKGKIIFAGFRSDVQALMGHFSVFCLTSTSEGTPNVVLEAMAAGLPVVATRVGGIPDVVQEGVTGFLVDPGDVAGMARAILTLLRDPSLAERMGMAGRQLAKNRYNCHLAAQRLTELYLQALTPYRQTVS